MTGYRLFAISTTKVVRSKREYRLAPSATQCAMFGRNAQARFVARYFPSKRGWRLLDIHRSRELKLTSGKTVIVARFLPQVYPHEDAAVMAGIAMASMTSYKG